MIGWLSLLAVSLAFAIAAWLHGRPAGWIFPSDVFFIFTLLTVGSVPFINLYARTPLFSDAYFSDHTAREAVIGLSFMYLCFGVTWMLRPKLRILDLLPHSENHEQARDQRAAIPFLWIGALAFLGVSVLPFAHGPYLAYKNEVFSFLSAQITAEDYRDARRILFVGDPVIEIVSRLRYGVLPVFFVGLCILAVRRLGNFVGFAVAAVAFSIGPASMSKAPIFVYLAYFLLAAFLVKGVRWPMKPRNFFATLAVAIPSLLLMLAGVYFLQYGFQARDFISAIDTAYYRLFLATYDGLLRYMTAYEGGDVGLAGLPFLVSLFGEETRNLDTEVAYLFLGSTRGQYTSFPTIFIGNAYASFGYAGVAAYSFVVAWALWLIDKGFVMVRNRDLRIVYYATMTVNVLFFAVLAAPTAFLTYGCAILPLMVLGADRLLAQAGKRRTRRAFQA